MFRVRVIWWIEDSVDSVDDIMVSAKSKSEARKVARTTMKGFKKLRYTIGQAWEVRT